MKAIAFAVLVLFNLLGCGYQEESGLKTVPIKWISGRMPIPDGYKVVSYHFYENLPRRANGDTARVEAHLRNFRSVVKDSTRAIFLVDTTNYLNQIVITPIPHLPITPKTERLLVRDLNKKGKESNMYQMKVSVVASSVHVRLFRRFNYIKIKQRVVSGNGERYSFTFVVTKGRSTVVVHCNDEINTDFERFIAGIEII